MCEDGSVIYGNTGDGAHARTRVGVLDPDDWMHATWLALPHALRRPPLAPLLKGRRPVSDHVARRFAGRYDASNARLRALCGPALDLTGYP